MLGSTDGILLNTVVEKALGDSDGNEVGADEEF